MSSLYLKDVFWYQLNSRAQDSSKPHGAFCPKLKDFDSSKRERGEEREGRGFGNEERGTPENGKAKAEENGKEYPVESKAKNNTTASCKMQSIN